VSPWRDVDQNIYLTLRRTADGFLFNNSQVCVATSRLLVQESIAPQFIEAVKARFAHAISLLGNDPQAATTAYGPMADKAQFERVLGFIEKGRQGGEPLIGGRQKGTKGLFIEPTIFVNPDKDSTVYKDEIFGPVLSIRTFKTEEEGIELANDTNTGLSGGLIRDQDDLRC
jgi:aldehyde dehydrogenase (NAD+)